MRLHPLATLSALALTLALGGCSGDDVSSGGSDGCTNNDDCGSGEICSAGSCETLCASDDQCDDSLVCVDSLCVTGERQLPVITRIDGDDSEICPDGGGTHCIAGGLIVEGSNFDGASFALRSTTGGADGVLTLRADASDSYAALDLSGAAPGTYTLVVTNAAGPAQADVTLLQGPAGSADTGDMILVKLAPVDGSGSGLDADLLDGLEASAFVQASAADQNLTGNLDISGTLSAGSVEFGGCTFADATCVSGEDLLAVRRVADLAAMEALTTEGQIVYRYDTGRFYGRDASAWSPLDGHARASCLAIYNDGVQVDGVYTIDPDGAGGAAAFSVYCDMSGGGWTRVSLYTRQWGNADGFASDPNGSYGERLAGATATAPLDDLTSCAGDSQVAIRWAGEAGILNDEQVIALNGVIGSGNTGTATYSIYDSDGGDDWDSVKGCFAGSVVMTGDGSEFGATTGSLWANQFAVDSLSALFTTGFYGGNSNASGYNASLPRYWYFQ